MHSLLEMMSAAAIAVDDARTVVSANNPATSLFGYTTEELRGRSFQTLFSRLIANDAHAVPHALASSDFRVDLATIRMAIAKRKDGSELAVTMKTARYNASTLIVMIVDQCEQRERRSDEPYMTHLARVYELSEMAGALAHEINQPLTTIMSNAQAARRFLELNPANESDLREALDDIVTDSFRASEIVRKMRQFVRMAPPETLSLDMGSLMRDVGPLVRRDAVARGIRVTWDIAGDLPVVRGDKIQLQQVMVNLLMNAFDAVQGCCAEDRVISVTVGTGLQGDGVSIQVRDRGHGLRPDQLGEIFKAFSTSKAHGLGLGLTISNTIVTMHGGRMWAECNSDRGASFHIVLPSESAATATPRPQPQRPQES